MKLSGVTYYWLIFSGLALGLTGGLLASVFEAAIDSSMPLKSIMVLVMLISGICYYTVIWEMWDTYRAKLLLVAASFIALGLALHSVFLGILVLSPFGYWIWRINGVPFKKHT